jgi:hypothetical protein
MMVVTQCSSDHVSVFSAAHSRATPGWKSTYAGVRKTGTISQSRAAFGDKLTACAAVEPDPCTRARSTAAGIGRWVTLSDVFMNLFDLDDRVTAAAIAAAGTVIGTLIQLKFAWRKEVSERARGVPATKKSRRGPVLAVGLLLVGAVVGGFAFSQYLVRQSDFESAARHSQLQTQLAQISATAARLERATLSNHGSSEHAADDHHGAEGVTVTTTVGPCRARAVVAPDAAPGCDEQEAPRVTLCASVPSLSVVTTMDLYARHEDSPQPWTESRVSPGQDVGRARFAEKAFERAESDQTKQVCTGFSSWDGEQGYSARLVVKYVIAPAASEVANALPVAISGVAQ